MAESASKPVTMGTAGGTAGNGQLHASAGREASKTNTDLVAELASYLAKLGLDDAHLTQVMGLLQATHGDHAGELAEVEDRPSRSRRRQNALEGSPAKPASPSVAGKTVTLFVIEEQQILRNAYQGFFAAHPSIELLGCSSDTSAEGLVASATSATPRVMLVGVKGLHASTVDKLETLRDACPGVGLVLLFAIHDSGGIRALREFSRGVSGGRAYLSKHSVDTVDQLTQAVMSVAEGRIIVDATIMEELIKPADAPGSLLRDLSPRALEVLAWVAKGYRNEQIADILSRDVKTIERHINNIYSTLLEPEDESRHPRVRAALMYLRASGLLSSEQVLGK